MKTFLLALAMLVIVVFCIYAAGGALNQTPAVSVNCDSLESAPIDIVERCAKVEQSKAKFDQEQTIQWLEAQQNLRMRGLAVSLTQLVAALAGGAFLLTLGFGGGRVIVNWLDISSNMIRPKNGLYPIQKLKVGNNVILVNPNTGHTQVIEAPGDPVKRLIGQTNQPLRISQHTAEADAATSRQNMIQAIQAAQKLPPGSAANAAVQAATKATDLQQENFDVKKISPKQLATVSLDGAEQPLLLEDEI